MSITVGKKDIIWSYIAQLANYGSGLILLPFILMLFSAKEVGLWYLFLNATSLAIIMDLGFMPNITRIVSYIYSGAQSLTKEGLPENNNNDQINFELLKSVIKVIKNIYGIISLILVLVILIGGSFYLRGIIQPHDVNLWLAFYIFSCSICLNVFYSYYDALLLGRGLIKSANQAISISKITYLSIAIIGILLGGGLLSIAIANLLSTLLNRILYYNRFYDKATRNSLNKYTVGYKKEIFSVIFHNAKKLAIVSLATFFIFQMNLLLAGKYFSIGTVASLGLTMQLFSTLANFSRLYFTTLIPRFNSLRIKNDYISLKNDFIKSMKIGWIVYVPTMILICFLGNFILTVLHSHTILPSAFIMFLYGIVYLMEITHGSCGIFLTTKNTVPYVRAAISTGLGIMILNLALLNIFKLHIETFAISTVFMQLLYNAWKWPYEVSKDLNLKWKDLYAKIF